MPENLSELGPEKDQLEMGCRQILLDPKTKAWVDEQNKIKKKDLGMVEHMMRVRIQCTQALN